MRKGSPKKRYILPDPKFNDVMVTKFVNNLMLDGKKNKSFKIFYHALDIVAEKLKDEENKVLNEAEFKTAEVLTVKDDKDDKIKKRMLVDHIQTVYRRKKAPARVSISYED